MMNVAYLEIDQLCNKTVPQNSLISYVKMNSIIQKVHCFQIDSADQQYVSYYNKVGLAETTFEDGTWNFQDYKQVSVRTLIQMDS